MWRILEGYVRARMRELRRRVYRALGLPNFRVASRPGRRFGPAKAPSVAGPARKDPGDQLCGPGMSWCGLILKMDGSLVQASRITW